MRALVALVRARRRTVGALLFPGRARTHTYRPGSLSFAEEWGRATTNALAERRADAGWLGGGNSGVEENLSLPPLYHARMCSPRGEPCAPSCPPPPPRLPSSSAAPQSIAESFGESCACANVYCMSERAVGGVPSPMKKARAPLAPLSPPP